MDAPKETVQSGDEKSTEEKMQLDVSIGAKECTATNEFSCCYINNEDSAGAEIVFPVKEKYIAQNWINISRNILKKFPDPVDVISPMNEVYQLNSLDCRGNEVGVIANGKYFSLCDMKTAKASEVSDVQAKSGNFVMDLRFDPKHPDVYYTCSTDGYVRSYDLRRSLNGKEVNSFSKSYSVKDYAHEVFGIPLLCLDLDQSGSLICSGSEQYYNVAYSFFWDVRKRSILGAYFDCHSDDITQVNFHKGKKDRLLTGSSDGLVNEFNISEKHEHLALETTFNIESSVHKLHYIGNDHLVCITHMSTLQYWNLNEIVPVFVITREDIAKSLNYCSPVQDIVDCHALPNSEDLLLITCNSLGTVHFSKINHKGDLEVISINKTPHKSSVRCAQVNYQAEKIITCGDDATICEWSISK